MLFRFSLLRGVRRRLRQARPNSQALLGGLTRKRAEEFSLVLSARNLEHSLERGWRGYYLKPSPGLEAAAAGELAAYLDENRKSPGSASVAAASGEPLAHAQATLWSAALVAVMFSMFGSRAKFFGNFMDWSGHGGGNSTAMLAGAWERSVTALCLHADPAHLFSNLLVGTVLMLYLCSQTGTGLGWLLALFSGVLGNLLKVYFQGPGHLFIGSSTAVFGVVGLLGAMRFVLHGEGFNPRRFLPLAAALMFLALMGSGEDSFSEAKVDLAGHFFGFVSGLGLGLGAALSIRHFGNPPAWLNHVCAVCAWGLVITAWILALA